MPTNDQGAAQAEEGGRSWFRTILNGLAIYLAINAFATFIGGRLGGQQQAGAQPAADGTVKTGPAVVEQIPPLWALGTKMVMLLDAMGLIP